MRNCKPVDLVAAIHQRVRELAASYHTPEVAEDWSNELARLHSAYNTAYCARNLVGTTPQLPNNLTGRVAGWLIAFAQRLLFWYTPQVRYFHEATTTVLNRMCALEERRFHAFLAMSERVAELEREVRQLRVAPAAAVSSNIPDGPRVSNDAAAEADTARFYFELQRRFQAAEPADSPRFQLYRRMIDNLEPGPPGGPWLDIGCGTGNWLRGAKEMGRDVYGVDSSPAAIQACHDAAIPVTQGDALQFLRSSAGESYAVITGFHVLEHVPFEYLLNLFHQFRRTLRPGGVLLVETPHPGNLLMAAEQFWIDPTHCRPIPMSLMEFLFEYCGIDPVRRFEINPRDEAEHLPFTDLELAGRLDQLLYGPQDYAILGRREPS